jgi:hypothetical protein
MRECWEGESVGKEGKRKILRGEEDESMLCVYICEDSTMKPTKHCLIQRGRRRGKMGI